MEENNVWNNEEFVIGLLESQGILMLRNVGSRLKEDKKFYLKILDKFNFGWIVCFASDKVKDDEQVMLKAIEKPGESPLRYASDRLRNNKAFMKKVLEKSPKSSTYKWVGAQLFDDDELFHMAFKHDVFCYKYASERLKEVRENAKKVMLTNGFYLMHAPESIRDDKEIVLLAVNHYVEILNYVSERLKADKDVVMTALRAPRCTSTFEVKQLLNKIDKKLRNDEEVVLSALEGEHVDIGWAGSGVKKEFESLFSKEAANALNEIQIREKEINIMKYIIKARGAKKEAKGLAELLKKESQEKKQNCLRVKRKSKEEDLNTKATSSKRGVMRI